MREFYHGMVSLGIQKRAAHPYFSDSPGEITRSTISIERIVLKGKYDKQSLIQCKMVLPKPHLFFSAFLLFLPWMAATAEQKRSFVFAKLRT
jgi:hypothetical protein